MNTLMNALAHNPPLTFVHLYPREMNIYGDHGNFLTLQRRMQWRHIPFEVVNYHPGDRFPAQADLIIGGGGQDSGQSIICHDLPRIKEALTEHIESGAAALVVCGTYQLFGNSFKTVGGELIEGLGIFDLHTIGAKQRYIGNIVVESELFGTIVGYENHSGKTYLASGLTPLAKVLQGAGNNGADNTEGVHYQHALGTYIHGPLLPKNPAIADYLIAKALEHRLGRPVDPAELAPLLEVDECATQAARIARTRPR